MAWAGSARSLPALLISRLWFNSRMSSCQVDGPGAIPGSRTSLRPQRRSGRWAVAPNRSAGGLDRNALHRASARQANSSQAARQHAAESPKLSLLRAARRQPAIFIWGRGRQAMHLPCKQAYVGALPIDSTSLRLRRRSGRRLPRRSEAKAGLSPGVAWSPFELRLGQPISNCGKLDQSTERSLINFFRWV